MAIWPPKVANKLFSWALVCQVAMCRFHACVYRRNLTPCPGVPGKVVHNALYECTRQLPVPEQRVHQGGRATYDSK